MHYVQPNHHPFVYLIQGYRDPEKHATLRYNNWDTIKYPKSSHVTEARTTAQMKDILATLLIHVIETSAPILVAMSVPLSIIYVAIRFS
jgi:hypothetical protein